MNGTAAVPSKLSGSTPHLNACASALQAALAPHTSPPCPLNPTPEFRLLPSSSQLGGSATLT